MLRRINRAFTLVELLVVIAIIGILIALLLPAVQAAREAARRSQCTNNLKQLSLSLQNYHDVNKAFPAGSSTYTVNGGIPGFGSLNQNWITRVLPFVEQSSIDIDMVSPDTLWTGTNPGSWQAEVLLQVVLCPSDERKPVMSTTAPTNYVGCTGSSERMVRATNGTCQFDGKSQKLNEGVLMKSGWQTIATIKDGTSNTMAVSECRLGTNLSAETSNWPGVSACMAGSPTGTDTHAYVRGWSWYAAKYPHSWAYNAIIPPNDKITKATGFDCYDGNRGSYAAVAARSYHPGGVNVGMVDGSVRFVSETIDILAWRAAASMRGGESRQLE